MSLHERPLSRAAIALIAGAVLILAAARVPAAGTIFRNDDPLAREPRTQDASQAAEWTIDLFIDLATNLFGQPGARGVGVHAANVNTIDEVPDSDWFTNRILAQPLSVDDVVRGPQQGNGPAPGTWTVIGAKEIGVSPGFTIRDSAGESWFITFDPRGYPEGPTASILVANKIFWALGYWQVDTRLARVRPEQIVIGESATVKPMSGNVRRMRASDLEEIWDRSERSPDGSYRAVAGRRLPGRALGGFRYYGTRPDDPNDVVPHEHRRELRALKVFGAWTNLVDMKAGNTLDVLVTEEGRGFVRHYLQDVGSTFGFGATGPLSYDEGWEHLYEGGLVRKRLLSLGFVIRPWQTVEYADMPTVGHFEGVEFDPLTWKPRVPTAAFRHAQPDDGFWAARRVMAFSDEMIRAMAQTGSYSDPAAARHLADVLIQRRDKIGAAYLNAVTPLVGFSLSREGRLSFVNAASAAGVGASPRGGYDAVWERFDNATGQSTPIGNAHAASGEPLSAPAALPDGMGAFVRIRVSAVNPADDRWKVPVTVHFQRTAEGWRLVALDRSGQPPAVQPSSTR